MTSIDLTSRLHSDLKAAGIAIDGISGVLAPYNPATVVVSPSNLQASAQSIINAFDGSQSAQDLWALRKKMRLAGSAFGVRKTADQTTNSGTLVDVTDLEFELDANSHYTFRFTGGYIAVGATTGIQIAIDGPASPAFFRAVGQISESITTVRNGAVGAYNTVIPGAASGGATAMPFWIEGNITTGTTPGKLKLRMQSETAGSNVSILRGSQGLLLGIN